MMHLIRKGQTEGIKKGEIEKQIKFINDLFALAA
ncbi:MAG: integrase [Desulfobacteraceae bacterium]|nr:integrase [Desulfobacteraceae bacterium]